MRQIAAAAGLCFLLCLVALGTSLGAAADEARPGVLISRQLAEARHLAPGSTIHLSNASSGERARPFVVQGIYEPTPNPMEISESKFKVRLHLPDFARLITDPKNLVPLETVDQVNLALRDPAQASAAATRLMTEAPGLVARPVRLAVGGAGTFVVIERFHLAIAVVTIIASALFLLALSVMLVDERRDTVGVLRLIGLTSRRVLGQVFLEGLIVAAGGSLFGLALAAGSQALINQYFQWHYNTALVFVRVTPAVALLCLAIAIPLGVIASGIASWALLRRQLMALARR